MTYPVNNAVSEVGDENGKAVAWEKAFIQLVKVWALFFFFNFQYSQEICVVRRYC